TETGKTKASQRRFSGDAGRITRKLCFAVLQFFGMISLALLRVIAVLVLVAANAFFVAAEFALVSIRETRLQQLIAAGRTGARAVERLHRSLDQLLSGVQFGVTLTSLGLGWAGEVTIASLLLPSFSRLPHAAVWAHSVAATA